MGAVDSFEIRYVQLAKDKDNKDTLTNNNLIIEIKDTLPLVTIDDDLISNNTAVSTTYDSTMDNDSIKNYPVDVEYKQTHTDADGNGVDRFIYITKVTSAISKNIIRLFYDRKYNDIIVVPALDWISQTIIGQTYNILANRIGGGDGRNEVASDLILPVNDKYLLPETNENISNDHYFVKMHGVSTPKSGTFYVIVDADHRVRDEKLLPTGMLSLGSMSDLFVTEELLPTFTIYQITSNRFASKYVGNVIPDNIYLPITF